MNSIYAMNPTSTNSGGYKGSEMRTYLNQTIYNKLPEDLKELITPACKSQSKGSLSVVSETVTDKLWLPAFLELGTLPSRERKTYEGRAYSIYYTDVSKIKYANNGAGNASSWYTRSPSVDSLTSFINIANYGGRNDMIAGNPQGVAFGFCI